MSHALGPAPAFHPQAHVLMLIGAALVFGGVFGTRFFAPRPTSFDKSAAPAIAVISAIAKSEAGATTANRWAPSPPSTAPTSPPKPAAWSARSNSTPASRVSAGTVLVRLNTANQRPR